MLHQWLEHRGTRKTAYTFPHDALAGLIHGPECLDPLPAAGPRGTRYPGSASAVHEGDGPEQVALDHQAVEPGDPHLGIDELEYQSVLDRGSLFIHG